MKNKLAVTDALLEINKLSRELKFFPLDDQERTKAQGFAVGGEDGKQFLLILGKNKNEPAKQTRIIFEKIPIADHPSIYGVEFIPEIYKGSRVNQLESSLGYPNHLKDGNQSNFIVEDMVAFKKLIRWYVSSVKSYQSKIEKSSELESTIKPIEVFEYFNVDQSVDIFEIVNQPIKSTTKEQLIQARLGQGKFRKNVINTWGIGEQCAVTGIDIKPLLVASHIIPWRDSDGIQRLSGTNGILLCSHLDKLFDQCLVSFDELLRLVFSKRLTENDCEHLKIIGITESTRLNEISLKAEDRISIVNYLNQHSNRLKLFDLVAK